MTNPSRLHRVLSTLFALSIFFLLSAPRTASSRMDASGDPTALNSSLTSLTLIVTTTLDAGDSNPGDGICASETGQCTLRAAIMEGNTFTGGVLIRLPAGNFQFSATPPVSAAHLITLKEMIIEGISPFETILDGSGVPPAGTSLPVIHAMENLTLRKLSLINGGSWVTSAGYYDSYETYGGVTARKSLVLDQVESSMNTMGVYAAPLKRNGIPEAIPNVVISNSSIHHNRSSGIQVEGLLNMRNSTVSSNETEGVNIYGSAAISNSTITNNTLTIPGYSGAGGINHSSSDGTVLLDHTIVAGNTNWDLPSDCRGVIQSNGFNLMGSLNQCEGYVSAAGDIIGVNPLLGQLAFNGGLTRTHALLVDSPAIDAGNPAGCGTAVDQRGLPRPRDGNGDGISVCEIGATESQFKESQWIYLPLILK